MPEEDGVRLHTIPFNSFTVSSFYSFVLYLFWSFHFRLYSPLTSSDSNQEQLL